MAIFKTIEEAEKIVADLITAVKTVETTVTNISEDFSGFREKTEKAISDGAAGVEDLKKTFQKNALAGAATGAKPEGPSAIDRLAHSAAPVNSEK